MRIEITEKGLDCLLFLEIWTQLTKNIKNSTVFKTEMKYLDTEKKIQSFLKVWKQHLYDKNIFLFFYLYVL